MGLEYSYPLCEVCNRLLGTFDLEECLSLIVRTVRETLHVKGSSLRLLDGQGKRLTLVAADGLSQAYLEKGPVEVDQSPLDREALEGNVVTILDATRDPRFQYPDAASKEGIRSLLCVPLRIGKRPIGVLRAYTSEPHLFTEEEIRVLYTLACHGAAVIENVRLREHVQKDYDQLLAEVGSWYEWVHRSGRLQ